MKEGDFSPVKFDYQTLSGRYDQRRVILPSSLLSMALTPQESLTAKPNYSLGIQELKSQIQAAYYGSFYSKGDLG